jgi:hypothetical protein
LERHTNVITNLESNSLSKVEVGFKNYIESGVGIFGDDAQWSTTWPTDDGWILCPNGELLFWVPPLNCLGLWHPRNTAIKAEKPTKLDFTYFVHGLS